MAIKVNAKNQNLKRKVNLDLVKKAAKIALKSIGLKSVEVNILLVSNQKIRAMNRKYLGIDSATDVIAWPSAVEFNVVNVETRNFLGDIAISSDKARQNAELYGNTAKAELLLYVIHGILHLSGMEDRTDKGRKAMRRKENELLGKVEKAV